MPGVRVSEVFGIIVRKSALATKALNVDAVLTALEVSQPLDEDSALLSFGPHFGSEASQEFGRRLELLGLTYGEDFIDFSDMLPEWCAVYVAELTGADPLGNTGLNW